MPEISSGIARTAKIVRGVGAVSRRESRNARHICLRSRTGTLHESQLKHMKTM